MKNIFLSWSFFNGYIEHMVNEYGQMSIFLGHTGSTKPFVYPLYALFFRHAFPNWLEKIKKAQDRKYL